MKDNERANACTQCKECEELCPQTIPISTWMPKIAAEMETAEAT